MTAYSDATTIAGILALFFLLLALIALGRSILSRERRTPRRFRVGFFFEHDEPSDEPPDQQRDQGEQRP